MEVIFPITTDTRISNMRKRIIDMLIESRDLELGTHGNAPTLRYYKMTDNEFQDANMQHYAITIFYGKFPEAGSKTEGFVYDIRTLLKEKYVVLNELVCYFPITLSAKRWNHLRTKYADIGDFTFEVGRLTFPLYRTELSYIFKQIRSSPTICSSSDGCVPVTLEHLQGLVGLVRLPDESVDNRFGIVRELTPPSSGGTVFTTPSQSHQIIPVVTKGPEENKSETEQINSILKSVERELLDIHVDDPEILEQIKSEKTKQYVRDLLGKKSNVHIMSALISDALDKALSKNKIPSL